MTVLAKPPLHIFEAHGIELEYMLVDRQTLAVMPVCDRILERAAGFPTNEFETESVGWSNELALHVIELKTRLPVAVLDDDVAKAFDDDLRKVNQIALHDGAMILPGAMHPTMDPSRETKLWPHDNRPIYAAFDRIFGCQGHGWGNLQSCHLNLPFANDDEFGRLHAAIRAVLPLLPALAASSPIVEGHRMESLDHRLLVYAQNQRRIRSVMGELVPEPVFTPKDYRTQILAPMYADIGPLDPEGLLAHEWLNSRGAIARFDRNAIEIRVLDVQETPCCDLAIAKLATRVIRALADETWAPIAQVMALATTPLRALLDRTIDVGERATVAETELLRVFGRSQPITAGELWTELFEFLREKDWDASPRLQGALHTILEYGPLARRVLARFSAEPTSASIRDVYLELAECAVSGRPLPPV